MSPEVTPVEDPILVPCEQAIEFLSALLHAGEDLREPRAVGGFNETHGRSAVVT